VTKSPGEKQNIKNIFCTGKKKQGKNPYQKNQEKKTSTRSEEKQSKQRATQHHQQQEEQKRASWCTATKYSVLCSASAASSVAELVTYYYCARRTIESGPWCVISSFTKP
jgi:hypothetical protein